MYDRILYPTDGSEGATAALDTVRDFAETYGATVHLLFVADTSHEGFGLGHDPKSNVAGMVGEPEGGDGGFVELSGSNLDASLSNAEVEAPKGENGTVLFDPTSITIQGGSGSGDAGDPIDVAFGDGPDNFTVFESELEGTGSDIVLEATEVIETSTSNASFGDDGGTNAGDLLLSDGVSLTLRTRNDANQGDGAGGVDLTAHGNPLEVIAQGSGAVTAEGASGSGTLRATHGTGTSSSRRTSPSSRSTRTGPSGLRTRRSRTPSGTSPRNWSVDR